MTSHVTYPHVASTSRVTDNLSTLTMQNPAIGRTGEQVFTSRPCSLVTSECAPCRSSQKMRLFFCACMCTRARVCTCTIQAARIIDIAISGIQLDSPSSLIIVDSCLVTGTHLYVASRSKKRIGVRIWFERTKADG